MYYLIAEKISHSYSKIIHEQFGYDYELKALKPEKVEGFVYSGDFQGFNVTIPYKKQVIRYLDKLDESADKVGSVNTVVKINKQLVGFNTDILGAKYLLDSLDINYKNRKVLVLGSGGAGVTLKYVLENLGAEVVIISRKGDNRYGNISKHKDASVIINCTPIGMYPDTGVKLVDLNDFPSLVGVGDLIYNPLKTALILQAEKMKIKCVNGLGMLVAQAIASKELFLNNTYPTYEKVKEETNKIYPSLLKKIKNITLIGMPFSGKSEVGKMLSSKLNLPFFDTDKQFYKLNKIKPADFIKTYGEKEFRKQEYSVLTDTLENRGVVVSTGGGILNSVGANDKIRENSFVVWLQRLPKQEDIKDRPLTKTIDEFNRLYEKRKLAYSQTADIIVDNNNSVEQTVEKIIEAYYENINN